MSEKPKGLFGAIGNRLSDFVGGLKDVCSVFGIVGFVPFLIGVVPAIVAAVVAGAVDNVRDKAGPQSADSRSVAEDVAPPKAQVTQKAEPSPEDLANREGNRAINQLCNQAFNVLNSKTISDEEKIIQIDAKLKSIEQASGGVTVTKANNDQRDIIRQKVDGLKEKFAPTPAASQADAKVQSTIAVEAVATSEPPRPKM